MAFVHNYANRNDRSDFAGKIRCKEKDLAAFRTDDHPLQPGSRLDLRFCRGGGIQEGGKAAMASFLGSFWVRLLVPQSGAGAFPDA